MDVRQNTNTAFEIESSGRRDDQRTDAFAFLAILAFMWSGVIFGFVPRIYQHIVQNRPAYLPVVHAHTVAFLGWMILFTTQIVLARSKNVAAHRRLGRLAYIWGPATIFLGAMTQVAVSQARFGTPRWDPPFLAIPFADLVNFGALLGVALYLRGDGAAHKRLMILATSSISNVGFARWWGQGLGSWLGDGFFSEMAQDYLGGFVVIAVLISFDVAVRGRPSVPVLIAGAFILGIEAFATYLYFSPWWLELTIHLLLL